jgi:hypothetical protein
MLNDLAGLSCLSYPCQLWTRTQNMESDWFLRAMQMLSVNVLWNLAHTVDWHLHLNHTSHSLGLPDTYYLARILGWRLPP